MSALLRLVAAVLVASASSTQVASAGAANARETRDEVDRHGAVTDPFEAINQREEVGVYDKAFPDMGLIWPNGVVAVCWVAPVPEASEERHWVEAAVGGSWGSTSGIRFVGWKSCAAGQWGIWISVEDRGDLAPHVKCLGRCLDGRVDGMVLNFTFREWNVQCSGEKVRRRCIEYIAIHEFGHALGFAHEQNRADTPGACAKRKQEFQGTTIDLTPWDINSVMNYCNPNWVNNGRLSKFDIQAAEDIYGRK